MSDYQNPLTRASRNLDQCSVQGAQLREPLTAGVRGAPDWLHSESIPEPQTKGIKHDQEKEPLSLLSRTWLLGVARVMAFGAKKYAAHNWRGGIERSRLISAALRHIVAYNEGQDLDTETGLSHLDHASCCLMFARETHETHPHLDDRYKQKALK